MSDVSSAKCPLCSYVLVSVEARRSHIRIFHGGMVKPFGCGLCGLTLWSSMHLKAHILLHTNEQPLGDDGVSCDYCRETFASNKKLHMHVEKRHSLQVR